MAPQYQGGNWRQSQTNPNFAVSPEVDSRVNNLFLQGMGRAPSNPGGYRGAPLASGPGQNLAGAFGGRVVPTYNGMVAHPMALNATPMSQQTQQGDPGLWYNQSPQGFNARGYVDANSAAINAGRMRAVANFRPDGGVQLKGGGQYMDAMEQARIFQGMGGKGVSILPDGSVTMGGRPIDDRGMFQAVLQQRVANRQGKEADMARNARVRNAMGDAQRGNLAPLMAAAQAGLVNLPQQGAE